MQTKRGPQTAVRTVKNMRELRRLFADTQSPSIQTKRPSKQRVIDRAQLMHDISSASTISAGLAVNEACLRLSKKIAERLMDNG